MARLKASHGFVNFADQLAEPVGLVCFRGVHQSEKFRTLRFVKLRVRKDVIAQFLPRLAHGKIMDTLRTVWQAMTNQCMPQVKE